MLKWNEQEKVLSIKELTKLAKENKLMLCKIEERIDKLERVNDYPNEAELARMAECEGTD